MEAGLKTERPESNGYNAMIATLRAFLPCTLRTLIERVHEQQPALRAFCDQHVMDLKPRDKGRLGKMVEFYVFGRLPNNDRAPDLGAELGDLKVTHFKKTRNGWTAKERLTLTNVGSTANYETLQHLLVDLPQSTVYPKIRRGLVVVFEDVRVEDPLDKPIHDIFQYDLETLPEDVQQSMATDWASIQDRVRTQTVSQVGQKTLHIHPHGSKGSSTRAIGFTPKFLTRLRELNTPPSPAGASTTGAPY